MTRPQNPEMSNVDELRDELLRPGRFDFHTRHSSVAFFDGKPIKYDFFESDLPVDDVPIMISNGYCAPAVVYDAIAIGLAQNGRNVIRFHPPRNVSLGRMALGGHIRNPLKKHSQAGWEVIKDGQKKYKFDKVDILGHSMGTPTAFMLAEQKPEAIRSVMCTGGAGLDGAGGLFIMAARGGRLLKNDVFDEKEKLKQLGNTRTVGQEIAKHILSHPLDTLAEGYYVSRADAAPSLIRVHKAGVRIGAILFEKDVFFRPNNVLNHVGKYFDYYVVLPDAKHIHPQIYPFKHSKEQIDAFAKLNSTVPTEHAA